MHCATSPHLSFPLPRVHVSPPDWATFKRHFFFLRPSTFFSYLYVFNHTSSHSTLAPSHFSDTNLFRSFHPTPTPRYAFDHLLLLLFPCHSFSFVLSHSRFTLLSRSFAFISIAFVF